MLDYFEKQENGTILIVGEGKRIVRDEPLSRILNAIALEGLSTVEGRILAIKKQFSLKAKVPIYLKAGLLLMPLRSLRSERTLLVNHYALKSVMRKRSGETVLFFWDGTRLEAGRLARMEGIRAVCGRIDDHLRASE